MTNKNRILHRDWNMQQLPESHLRQHLHGYHLSLFGILDPHEPGTRIALQRLTAHLQPSANNRNTKREDD